MQVFLFLLRPFIVLCFHLFVSLFFYQIKIIDKPEDHTNLFEVEATVLNSYFKGHYWLIEADFSGQIVFFNHATDLKNDAEIKLSFEPYKASH